MRLREVKSEEVKGVKREGAAKMDVYDPTKPFNEQIRELIRSTHPKDGPIVLRPFGKRFQVERDANYWKDFSELTGTDGIGTKGLLHWKMNTLHHGVQDVFAMVADDLIESGHVPVILQDHILMQEERQDRIFTIVKTLVELATKNQWEDINGKSHPIIISGGETAIINTLQGFEMGITATGYVKKGCEINAGVKEGDAVIGLGSSGVHSNGLSFFREEFFTKRNMNLDDALPWGATIGEELTKPTNVYLPAIKALIAYFANEQGAGADSVIHGMVHITGGGLSKLRELLPKGGGVDVEVGRDHSLVPQEIFRYAHEEFGVPSEKMYTRFNNGIGYVIAVDKSYVENALGVLGKYFHADVIGHVNKGHGRVMIQSQYEPITVKY